MLIRKILSIKPISSRKGILKILEKSITKILTKIKFRSRQKKEQTERKDIPSKIKKL